MSNHTEPFDFSEALRLLRSGKRLTRRAWQEGSSIYLCKGAINGKRHGFEPGEQPFEDHGSTMDGIRLGLFCAVDDDIPVPHLPYIIMSLPTGSIVHGWLASQTDLLASDWVLA